MVQQSIHKNSNFIESKLHEKIDILTESHKSLTGEVKDMKEKHEGEINQIKEKHSSQIKNITEEVKDMKEKHEDEINNMKDKMITLEDRIKYLQQKIQTYKKQRDLYQTQLEEALKLLATSKKELQDSRQEVQNLRKQLQNSRKEVVEEKNKIQIIEAQVQVNKIWQARKLQQRNQKIIQAEKREFDLKNKIQILEEEKKIANQKILEQQIKIGKLTFQVWKYNQSIKDYQKDLDFLIAQNKKDRKQIQKLTSEIDKNNKNKKKKFQEHDDYFRNMVNDLGFQKDVDNAIRNYFIKQNKKIIDMWIEDTKPTQIFSQVIKQMFLQGDFYFISSDIFSLVYQYFKDKSQESIRQLFNQVKQQSANDASYKNHKKFKRITKHHINLSFGFYRATSNQSENSSIDSNVEKNYSNSTQNTPGKMSQGNEYEKRENKQIHSYIKLNDQKQKLIKKIKRSEESIKEFKDQYKRLCGQHNANIVGEAKRKYNGYPDWLWKMIQSHFWSQQFQLEHMDVVEQIYNHCHQNYQNSVNQLCKYTICQAKNEKEKKQAQVVRVSLKHVNIAKKIVLESKEKDEL